VYLEKLSKPINFKVTGHGHMGFICVHDTAATGRQYLAFSKACCYYYYYICRQNRTCSARDSACSYAFLHSMVCHLSVTCVPPCLNRSTDLDAIWQVHLLGPMTHCDRWGLGRLGEGEILGVKTQAKTHDCKLQPNCQSYVAM